MKGVIRVRTLREINGRHAGQTLRAGIEAAIYCGDFRVMPVGALAEFLDAANDRAALVEGDDHECRAALLDVIAGLQSLRL